MTAHSMDLARLTGERGFRGYLNIDSLVTTEGNLIFTEFNGRMGVCTRPARCSRPRQEPSPLEPGISRP